MRIKKNNFAAWLTGFTDGEGCFLLYEKTSKQRANAHFVLALKADDILTMRHIKAFLKCGHLGIYPYSGHRQGKMARYAATKIPDLLKNIISHFDKYPLMTKKKRDYQIWKEGVLFLANRPIHSQWTKKQKQEFNSLAQKLKKLRKDRTK